MSAVHSPSIWRDHPGYFTARRHGFLLSVEKHDDGLTYGWVGRVKAGGWANARTTEFLRVEDAERAAERLADALSGATGTGRAA